MIQVAVTRQTGSAVNLKGIKLLFEIVKNVQNGNQSVYTGI